ncbi:MAG: hypothetical protein CMO98_08000 [Woeseia sp.]|nr:hypothetical protein [Woeseia sp.]
MIVDLAYKTAFGRLSVLHMLDAAAQACPDRIALIDDDMRVSYRDYVSSVNAFSQRLSSQGVAGHRVILLCENSVDFAIALYGIYAAGGQAVPISPAFTAHELETIIADCSPVVCIADSDTAVGKLKSARSNVTGELLIQKTGSGSASLVENADTNGPGGLREIYLPESDRLANLLYTGGTTGRPKGVNQTHEELSINLEQRQALVPLEMENERILCFMPMYHSFAMSLCVQGAVQTRNTLIIKNKFHPISILESLEKDQVTCLPAGPTALISLLGYEGFEEHDLSHLKLVISGSAALPLETLEAWERMTDSIICEGYGQTEAGPVLTFNPRDGERKAGTVGIVVPETELRIVDVDTAEPLEETGVAGEICAKGPQIMQNYHNRPEENAEALRDGWLFTGDVGFFDADGYLTICDRKKDMVIVSGYNVYPREINEILLQHPQVVEAATIGVPDVYRGELIQSFVIINDNKYCKNNDIKEFCKNFLIFYKIPAEIHIVTSLPKTSVGKINLVELRRILDEKAVEAGAEN